MNLPDRNTPENPPQYQQNRYADDEISLVDLWLVLARRRLLIAVVVLVFVTLGVAFAVTKPLTYSYGTTLEIGTRLVGDDLRAIEHPENVRAKILESYLPTVLQQHDQALSAEQGAYTARIPKNSEIVVLEAEGSLEKKETYLAVLSSVVERVQADHKRINDILKKEIEIRRNRVENALASLEDESRFLKSEVGRIKETRTLLERQEEETRQALAQTEKNRAVAVNQTGSGSNAMSLMLLDNEIRTTRERLGELEEKLKVGLESRHDTLVKEIANNLRDQSEKRDEMAKLDIELANFQDTRALAPPMQSPSPVGTGRKVIVILALVLGLMAGVFAAFFREFLSQVRKAELNNQ